ncbi:MAG: branched-chain amino acid transport system permease protein livM [Pseudonocardiales bacterium]|nr:branched-chain amino acid transport system permease protein livM [Pseudonocardiales bacterium]
MFDYIIAGLTLGSLYAIAASSITVTYVSTGILNFAFASFAYFLSRSYYYLHTQQGWGIVPAVLMVLLVWAPGIAIVLYFALLRGLARRSKLIQIVAMIGFFVALPPLAVICFGNATISLAPGLIPTPVHVYHVFGATIGLDQIVVFAFLIAILLVGTYLLLFTDIGLRVRGLVSSRALASLSGINPEAVSVGVWIVSVSLAGLVGILAAPTSGLTPQGMTGLMSAAFAAVVAARLKSLPIAVGIALLMGVFTDLVQYWLPSNSQYSAAVVGSAPFIVTALALIFFYIRYGAVRDVASGGALDAAIEPQGGDAAVSAALSTHAQTATSGVFSFRSVGTLVMLAVVAILPLLFNGYWLTLIAGGFVYGLIFLSFTLAVGEGGFLWLSLITFAGLGGVIAAQFATNAGWPVLLAVLVAAVIATPVGALLGLLTIRFGELYVALSTLIFGLMIETLVFTRERFINGGSGVGIGRPSWAVGDRTFAYLVLGIFLLVALFIINMRRSTTGLAFSAVRRSEAASSSVLGLNVIGLRVLIAAQASFVAALGGGFLAMYSLLAVPTNYTVFTGLAWLAVLVTIGARSVVAAIVAGLVFTLLPGIFQTYLSAAWGNVPTVLFGLGAIGLIMDPDGSVTMQARNLERLAYRLRRRWQSSPTAVAPVAESPEVESPDLAGTALGGRS